MKIQKIIQAMKDKEIFNLEIDGVFYTYVPGNKVMPGMLMKVDGHRVFCSDGTKFEEVFK